MIELHVADTDVSNGTIAVSWCLDKETVDLLKDLKVEDPQLVICVAPVDKYKSSQEYRKVVPLKDLMTYVEFRVPGKNNIWCFVAGDWDKRITKNIFLSKGYCTFETDILSYSGDSYSNLVIHRFDNKLMLSTPLSVNVPKECFAPEPPEWEKNWVNLFYARKPIDQCAYRKRRMVAYTIQPIIMFIIALLSMSARLLLLTIAALIGSKNWSLKYLRHPLTYDLDECVDVVKGGTIFVRPWIGKMPEKLSFSFIFKRLWALPLMPVIWIPILILCKFVLWHTFGWILITLVSSIIIVAFIMVILTGGYNSHINSIWLKINELLDRNLENKSWYHNQEEQDIILCDGKKKDVSIASLPAKKRTIWLRVENFKSKVCRPFSA